MTQTHHHSRTLRRLAAATALSGSALSFAAAPALADAALADLVEEVAPSVVTVLATRDAAPATSRTPGGSPFDEFFNRRGPGQSNPFPNQQPRQGLGSGFILDAEGWIVTNHHVVDGASSVTIRLSDNRTYTAEIIGTDAPTDIALLRIEAEDALPYVTLGDSSAIRVGEDVMAVGNPFGLGGTVTQGIVSAKGRNITSGPYADFLQTDAAINKGNSGGPLFNMEGEVVGVNSAIYSPTGGSVGVGFAVAANIVDDIVEDLRDDGEVERGWLGVSIQDVTPDLAAAFGLETPRGALVSSVVAGSPADGALETGDIIVRFDGTDVADSRALPMLVGAADAGARIDLTVLRNGTDQTVTLELGLFESAEATAAPDAAPAEDAVMEALGATVADLTDSARAETGVGEDTAGVVVTSLTSDGPAAQAGLRVGDVIVRLGENDIATPQALTAALSTEEDGPALMLINRRGQNMFLAVQIA